MKQLIALHPPVILFITSVSVLITVKLSWLAFFITPISIIFLCDCLGRYKDWKYISNKPKEWFNNQRLNYFGQSWCGRSLIKTAQPHTKYYYHSKGYRFYHVFPDKFLIHIKNLQFWINLIKGHEIK